MVGSRLRPEGAAAAAASRCACARPLRTLALFAAGCIALLQTTSSIKSPLPLILTPLPCPPPPLHPNDPLSPLSLSLSPYLSPLHGEVPFQNEQFLSIHCSFSPLHLHLLQVCIKTSCRSWHSGAASICLVTHAYGKGRIMRPGLKQQ